MSAPSSRCAAARRTARRRGRGARGAGAAARRLLGVEPRLIGSPGEPRERGCDDDLRDSRGCLLEAGGQVDDALTAGAFPVAAAADCSICITTLPAVAAPPPGRARPVARRPRRLQHARDDAERLPRRHVPGRRCGRLGRRARRRAARPGARGHGRRARPRRRRAAARARGAPASARAPPGEARRARSRRRAVYVHLDLDVLDPACCRAQFPAPGGLSPTRLRDLLGELADAREIVGVEVTAFAAPEDDAPRASVLEPLARRRVTRCARRQPPSIAAPARRGAARAPRARARSAAARRRSPGSTPRTS